MKTNFANNVVMAAKACRFHSITFISSRNFSFVFSRLHSAVYLVV